MTHGNYSRFPPPPPPISYLLLAWLMLFFSFDWRVLNVRDHKHTQGKPSLVISNHKLDGKVASEAKPLLVLRKVILADGDRGNETTDGSDSGGGGGEGSSGRRVSVAQPQQRQRQHRVQYQIVGKITNKTIFKTRPKPLIRKSGAPASSALSLQNKKV